MVERRLSRALDPLKAFQSFNINYREQTSRHSFRQRDQGNDVMSSMAPKEAMKDLPSLLKASRRGGKICFTAAVAESRSEEGPKIAQTH